MSVTREQMDAYRDDLRAYELRLCEWLGMDPGSVFRLDETKAGDTEPLDPPRLTVKWEATHLQPTERGRLVSNGAYHLGDPDEGPRYTGTVELDWQDLRDLRAQVGERPEMPGLAAARAAFDRRHETDHVIACSNREPHNAHFWTTVTRTTHRCGGLRAT